jgi:microcystin-dependent protein
MGSFAVAPEGWAMCNGQLLQIQGNQVLFSLIFDTYGGNGKANFAVPDLRGSVPVHVGPGFALGKNGGEASHVLTTPELPSHTHDVAAASGTAPTPAGNYWAGIKDTNSYSTATPSTTLGSATIGATGLGRGHDNMPPGLVLNYIIALRGIYPSRS